MDTSPAPTLVPTPAESAAHVADNWGWFLALGVLFILLGGAGLAMVGYLSVLSVVYIAALLLAGGVLQFVHAFRVQGWRGAATHVAGAVLYIVAGALLLAQPLVGLVSLTLVLGTVIIVTGVGRIVIALQHRPDRGWVALALSGVVGILLGVLIIAGLPSSALWVLGLFVAIELLMAGWGMVMAALVLRRVKRERAETET